MTAEPVSIDDITAWAPRGSCERLLMLRLDRIHPVVSGNKWFKLRPNLDAAAAAGMTGVLSFGGGYSNHLVVLAFAASEAGLKSFGIVRGHYPELTPALRFCIDAGMKLHFVHAPEYGRLRKGTAAQLVSQFPGYFIIPEGGANSAGITGAAAIALHLPADATDVCVPVGTGTTLAGLQHALPRDISLHGFCAAADCRDAQVLADAGPFSERIQWRQVADTRFGRWTPALTTFMQDFHQATGIALDVVYTGKMMQAVHMLLGAGRFKERNVVCIHTGGLQGNPPGLFMP